jgi:hypothetical protein
MRFSACKTPYHSKLCKSGLGGKLKIIRTDWMQPAQGIILADQISESGREAIKILAKNSEPKKHVLS